MLINACGGEKCLFIVRFPKALSLSLSSTWNNMCVRVCVYRRRSGITWGVSLTCDAVQEGHQRPQPTPHRNSFLMPRRSRVFWLLSLPPWAPRRRRRRKPPSSLLPPASFAGCRALRYIRSFTSTKSHATRVTAEQRPCAPGIPLQGNSPLEFPLAQWN